MKSVCVKTEDLWRLLRCIGARSRRLSRWSARGDGMEVVLPRSSCVVDRQGCLRNRPSPQRIPANAAPAMRCEEPKEPKGRREWIEGIDDGYVVRLLLIAIV